MVKKKPSGKPLDELLDDALQIKREATPDTGDLLFDDDWGTPLDGANYYREPIKDATGFANRAVSLAEARLHLINQQDELITDLRRIIDYLNVRYGIRVWDSEQATFLRAAKALLTQAAEKHPDDAYLRSNYLYCAVCSCELCVARMEAAKKAKAPGVYTIPSCCNHEGIPEDIIPF